jgi:hypothetical protein
MDAYARLVGHDAHGGVAGLDVAAHARKQKRFLELKIEFLTGQKDATELHLEVPDVGQMGLLHLQCERKALFNFS